MRDSLENWLRSLLGKNLKEVFALTYVFNSQKDFVNPQALDIRFESSHKGILRGSGDGESITWCEGDTIESRDLGEYGTESVEQVSHLEVWAPALENELQEFEIITSRLGCSTVGVALKFDNNTWVFILNYGDELCVFNEIPKEILDAEDFIFQRNLAGGL